MVRGVREAPRDARHPSQKDPGATLEWLGIEAAAKLDPHAFKAYAVNAALGGESAWADVPGPRPEATLPRA